MHMENYENQMNGGIHTNSDIKMKIIVTAILAIILGCIIGAVGATVYITNTIINEVAPVFDAASQLIDDIESSLPSMDETEMLIGQLINDVMNDIETLISDVVNSTVNNVVNDVINATQQILIDEIAASFKPIYESFNEVQNQVGEIEAKIDNILWYLP